MRTVWKYEIPAAKDTDGLFTLEVPAGGIALHVATIPVERPLVAASKGVLVRPHVWIQVDDQAELVPRRFQTFNSGQALPDGKKGYVIYVGTFFIPAANGMTVEYHLYEIAGN